MDFVSTGEGNREEESQETPPVSLSRHRARLYPREELGLFGDVQFQGGLTEPMCIAGPLCAWQSI